MKYVALLRGINVGKTKRIDMKDLKALFVSHGFADVSTYINSGNVIFNSEKATGLIRNEIESDLRNKFGYDIPVLVKAVKEIKRIVEKIPAEWVNDSEQRTDVAFLFSEADTAGIIDELPLRREYIDVRYTNGALYWNAVRDNYNKSNLNKLIGHRLYQFMTIRNVNTARYLSGIG